MQTEQILQQRYQLNQKLGQNAGRKTWLATDIQAAPPSKVILKLLAFNPQMQWEDLKLFEREAQVLKNIHHPRIPQYRDYFSFDDVENSGLLWFGLVQEYIPGESLKHLLDEGKPLPEKEVREIATQILRILIDLHELSPPILHRDIKPSNLLLGKNNQIYLVDFGAVQDKAKAEGATFTVVGTSGYAPPEQLWGKAVPASDLYALGATLIHLLSGIYPADLPQHQMQIQFRERVKINPEFANWIEQLIQPAPERRFSTASQALSALVNLQSLSLTNERSSQANSPNYVLGCLLTLFASAVPIFLIAFLIPSIFSGHKFAKQAEAKNNIGALNRAQQAYFLEYQEFTADFAQLGVGIKHETTNYSYSINANKNAAFNYGVSRNKEIKSYVGGVFAVPDTTVNPNPDQQEMLTVAIMCEALRPGTIKPAVPTIYNGQVTCGEGTKDLYKP